MKTRLWARMLAVVTTCLLLVTKASAGEGRGLSTNGDNLGTSYRPSTPPVPQVKTEFTKTKEIQDHAHFYSAADVLTRWAESSFALSADAHKLLQSQRHGPLQSACVYDGKQCLFNPIIIATKDFPVPRIPAEMVLKRFALEAFMCRGAKERADCHLDTNCDWDDLTSACYLAHDPHSDFTSAIMPCRDMLYTAVVAMCWRRKPQVDSPIPCGVGACRLFKAGSGASWGGDVSGGSKGIPEDRCMPDLSRGMWSTDTIGGPREPRLKPVDVYALLKRYFGSAKLPLAVLLNATALPGLALWDEGDEGQAEGGGEVPLLVGFGNCSTAMLHHSMKTTCRQQHEEQCLQDNRCSWLTGVMNGAHCVLSKDTVIEVLLGTGEFTKAVRKTDSRCRAAASEEACAGMTLEL